MSPRILRQVRLFVQISSWLVLAIGVLALLGRALNSEVLAALMPGHVAAKPNAALALVIAAGSLLLFQTAAPQLNRFAVLAASVVLAVGGLTLAEYAFRLNLPIDEFLFHEPAGIPAMHPGRMAVTTAVAFLLLGCSLLLLHARSSLRRTVAEFLALPVFALAMPIFLGYLFRISSLEGLAFHSRMSLPVALGLSLLSVTVLCTRIEDGLLRVFASEGLGGVMLRGLLPLVMVGPPLFAWLIAEGVRRGYFAAELEAVLLGIALMFVLTALVFWNAHSMDRTDAARRHAQQVLRNSRDQWELTFNCMSEGLSYHDSGYNIIGANEAVYGLLGQEKLAGVKCYEAFHGSDCPPDYCPMRRTLASGRTESSEVFEPRLGRYLNVRTDPVLDPQGRVLRVIHVVNDITARKQAEAAVHRLAAIVESADDAVIGKDLDGRIMSWNRAAERVYGYTEAEALGRSVAMLYPPDLQHEAGQVLENIRSGQRIESHETQRVRRDGTRIDVSLTISPILNPRGEVIGASTIARDITAQKRAIAEALKRGLEAQQARTRLDAVLASMGEGLYQLDEHGRLVYLNPAGERMLGYALRDIRGRSMHEVIHSRRPDGTEVGAGECRLMQVLRGGGSFHAREDYFQRADGSFIPVEYTSSPLLVGGEIIGAVLSFRDISERKRAEEQELRSRREIELKSVEIAKLNAELEERVRLRTAELEASNRELEAFSYSVSHDLRAPLRSIDGFSHILLEEHADKLDGDAQHCLNRVRAASQHMGQLIDALLQLSRVTRADMRRESVDLSALARAILDGLKQMAPTRKVDVQVAPRLHASGDPRLLQIALQNLLGNAFKFTSRRERAEIEFGSFEKDGSTVFFVRDNGAGFQMEYANKLFGAFQRLHTVNEFEGTGIGLATVQRIVRRHGGRVWAEGEPDKGATFYFTLC